MPSIIDKLMTREEFTLALVEGMKTPAHTDTELYHFGSRLIDFINAADNEYFCGWHPSIPNRVVVDYKNIEMAFLDLEPGLLIFLQPPNGAAADRPKDFGYIAEGAILFCMIENKDQTPPPSPPEETHVQKAKRWMKKRGISPLPSRLRK